MNARTSNRPSDTMAIPDEARIMSFSVGHGDCTLVEYRRGGLPSLRCLVDAGESLPASLPEYLRKNRRSDGGPDIDVLVLSHVDADHQGGLPDLIALDISIGEYLGPCLPAFERLASLFGTRVQNAIVRARAFENALPKEVAVVYPLEGFVSRHAQGRITLSVISPAARLLEKLAIADGGELASLLMHEPMPLDWLEVADADEESGDARILRERFRRGTSVYPGDFPARMPLRGINRRSLHDAAGLSPGSEPEFFGNAVLNDTSLVLVIDVHLDEVRRKRIVLAGDQENWSYLAARHPGGLGPDVLKAPHHGGRVYLRDRMVELDSLYLWLRPRTVTVSANGRHELPRLAFRDSVRASGATLLCSNRRGIEPLAAGTVAAAGEASCFRSYACSVREPGGFSTITLRAQDEYSDAYACVQGSQHTAPAPIVVIRQEVTSPSEKIVRYTSGELQRNARWIADELRSRHKAFVERRPAGRENFVARLQQQPVSWESILPAARAAGMHHLVADPEPVFRYARAYREFWTPRGESFGSTSERLYRPVTEEMLKTARAWISRIPHLLLRAPLTKIRIDSGDRLDILRMAEWEVLDGLLANLLALPQDVISDEIRPALLPRIAKRYTARACHVENPDRMRFVEGEKYMYVWLERSRAPEPLPDLENGHHEALWKITTPANEPERVWPLLEALAVSGFLVGNYFKEKHWPYQPPWTACFQAPTARKSFPERFRKAGWQTLWLAGPEGTDSNG